ncbi:hypothetical protein H257_07042 [Aphanomyces astaci]|uniref:COMM domain-containing protein n=1 Tax=Aphanomyces astaci TaxID=112090 RepID=W4GJE2_APHAT|nr:hypothetical protein H257_07042 [Aphanomyces astaci]ETV79825.1 hypothetical protein H257_07042 [Aphanomyces astaci]|eukprot:XP_009830761.1 hypothetical protein H257_07042 [Aphanomyces astaci]
MKFRFCGDLEPPAWLLAEIPCIAQSVQNGVDLDVVTGAIVSAIVKAASYDEVLDHLIAAVGEVDAKAILVSIKWILVHAAKYNVQEGVLLSEVQQLGLPSGVAGTLASVFHLHQQTLRRHLQLHNHLAPASSAVPCKWELSYTLATEAATELAAPSIQLTLGQPEKTIAFDLDVHTFRVLRQELHAARALMASSASHVE